LEIREEKEPQPKMDSMAIDGLYTRRGEDDVVIVKGARRENEKEEPKPNSTEEALQST
jgi:hypothetical protein